MPVEDRRQPQEKYRHEIVKRNVVYDDIDTELPSKHPKFDFWGKRITRDVGKLHRYNGYEIRKSSGGHHEYFIKTMVVADRLMLEYHKTREDLVHYILTLMSHVSYFKYY